MCNLHKQFTDLACVSSISRKIAQMVVGLSYFIKNNTKNSQMEYFSYLRYAMIYRCNLQNLQTRKTIGKMTKN